MSIRKRKWIGPGGEAKFAWVVDLKDLGGTRRLRTFRLKKEADRYATKVRAELLDAELKAKGPAATAIAPDHGSTIPTKDMKMNEVTNTTAEHPWEAARRHANDLSEALKGCNAPNWYAHVFPSDRPYSVCFAAKPHPEDADEMPIDRVNRLAWELSKALDEYADGRFSARVYPSQHAGTSVFFMSIASERRVAT